MNSNNWFEVSKEGLTKVMARRGVEFAIFELVQNAWDAAGVTDVQVDIGTHIKANEVSVEVRDNSPGGFADIQHAYTLFAESEKKQDATKRGRFNLGEKLAFAIAKSAKIQTTLGTITFSKAGRRHDKLKRTGAGSIISIMLKCNADTGNAITLATSIDRSLRRLIVPPGVSTSVNGMRLTCMPIEHTFTAKLPTELAGDDGRLRRSVRQCVVNVYKATHSVPAAIYELGIPVCELDGSYCVDVQQKIPLTMDRESVSDSFRRELAVAVCNAMHDKLSKDDLTTGFAKLAIEHSYASPELVNSFVSETFGDKAVIYDMSDPEANKLATAAGFNVVNGGSLSADAWANIRKHQAMLPAGKVTPSPKPYAPDGSPLTPTKHITEGMYAVIEYARLVARHVLKADISIKLVTEVSWPFLATYGPGSLTFNVGRLGKAWFDLKTNSVAIDNLLIHEFGHHYASDHLSDAYYDALTKIGAEFVHQVRLGNISAIS